MLKLKFLMVGFLVAIFGYVQAQAISGNFQKNCSQEQLEEHKSLMEWHYLSDQMEVQISKSSLFFLSEAFRASLIWQSKI
jgi:hypothetical protein